MIPQLFPCIALALAALPGGSAAPSTLKDAFKGDFLIGAALNAAQIAQENPGQVALIKSQFNCISPENVMKWSCLHPRPDRYDFTLSDRFVDLGQKNKMAIIGLPLVWHHQVPPWVFEDQRGQPVDRETLLARLRDHIHSVVGRYKGRVKGWDVVNEALNENGSLRQTPWLKIIGPEYLVKAFEFAHEADPAAELYYNDFNLENPAKRRGAVTLINKLQRAGVRLDAIGLQEHDSLTHPALLELDHTITAFADLGVKVMVTELDVDVLPRATASHAAEVSMHFEAQAALNPYAAGLPDSLQQALAARYADLFAVLLRRRRQITRVTFWGVTDGDSWLNNWPVPGRTSHPLLFDRQGRPKPAFDAVIRTATQSKP